MAGVRVIHRSTDLMDKLNTNILHKYDTNIGPLIVHRSATEAKQSESVRARNQIPSRDGMCRADARQNDKAGRDFYV